MERSLIYRRPGAPHPTPSRGDIAPTGGIRRALDGVTVELDDLLVHFAGHPGALRLAAARNQLVHIAGEIGGLQGGGDWVTDDDGRLDDGFGNPL